MTLRATLNVTTGPDRGKSFDLNDVLSHIGTGNENHVVLTDPSVAPHQASIACRDGRYFIYTPPALEIEVDGNKIPAEQRVWLPEEATIQVSRRTLLHFVCVETRPVGTASIQTISSFKSIPEPAESPGSAAPAGNGGATGGAAVSAGHVQSGHGAPGQGASMGGTPAAVPAPVRHPGQKTTTSFSKGRRPASDPDLAADAAPAPQKAVPARADKKQPTVAKFITDAPGDLLVRLGDDGHLPELTLDEGQTRAQSETRAKESNPLLLIAALCFSLGMTGLMLLVDVEDSGGSGRGWQEANQKIAEYYGNEDEELLPWQIHLRRARQAHSRRAYQEERDEYKKVLNLLHAEGKSRFTGLTGSPDRNKKLEEMISVLLGR